MSLPSTTPSKTLMGQYAGFTSRVIAFVLDITIVSLILVIVGWFIALFINNFNVLNNLEALSRTFPGISLVIDLIFSPITATILSVTFIFSYYVFFFFLTGQTLGKAFMGLKVVPLHGGKMPLWRAVVRYLGLYVSAIPLGLGYLWVLVDDRRLAWHDKLAGTCVIYAWNAKPDEKFLAGAIEELQARQQAVRAFLAQRRLGSQKIDLPEVVIPEITPAPSEENGSERQ